MHGSYEFFFKKKKKDNNEGLTPYHAKISFCIKEDLIPP